MKRSKKRKSRTRRSAGSRASTRRRFVAPNTPEELFALPDELQDKYVRVTQATTRMRVHRISRAQAARIHGLTSNDMMRFGKKALRKLKNGRYAAKTQDRLLRVLVIITEHGLEEIVVRDSKEATRIAKHSNAVHLYLRTGDSLPLEEFRNQYATDANGNQISFLTDLQELDRQGSAGNFSFETLYARAS